MAKRYKVSEFNANAYLKRFLTSEEVHEAKPATSKDMMRGTFYGDAQKGNNLNKFSVLTKEGDNTKSTKSIKE